MHEQPSPSGPRQKDQDPAPDLKAELAKLAFLLWGADLLARKDKYYYSVTPEQLQALPESARGGFDVDYTIDMPAFSSQANILKAVPNAACTSIDPCYVQVGTVPLSVSSDSMTATVPLSLLGNADGRCMFRIVAYVSLAGVASSYTADAMPDMTLPPAHVP
jgi:hypothetical protein